MLLRIKDVEPHDDGSETVELEVMSKTDRFKRPYLVRTFLIHVPADKKGSLPVGAQIDLVKGLVSSTQ